jgi:hypothetical protein
VEDLSTMKGCTFSFHLLATLTLLLLGIYLDETASADSGDTSHDVNDLQAGEDSTPGRLRRYCVDASPLDHYVCSDDPEKTRRELDGRHTRYDKYDVKQLVDGTEVEKQGSLDVIELSEAYYLEEVLSNPEYRNVRKYW